MRGTTFRLAVLPCLVVAVGFFLFLWTGVLGERGTTVLDDYLCTIVPVVAGALCLRRGRRAQGDRRGWQYLGASCLSWGAGGAVWTLYEVHLGVEVPFPSLADVGYLASVPLAVMALVRIGGTGHGAWGGARAVIDGALAASALLFLSWAAVLAPVVLDGEGSPLNRGIALAYPVMDVVLAAMALLAVSRAGGRLRPSMILMGVGLTAVAVSDSSFAWFTSRGSYVTGNLFDVGYVAGYLLIALAALHRGTSREPGDRQAASPVAVYVPYVPLLISATLVIVWHLRGLPVDSFLFWDGLLVVILVLARQLLSLNANLALSRQLRETVDALRDRESQLRHQAHHDGLTGLPNRALFAAEVHRRLQTPDAGPLTAMLLDIDDFKSINDAHGHHAGDLLLIAVARRLADAVRQHDTIARLGGDEFAVLLGGTPTQEDGDAVARRMTQAFENPVDLGGTSVTISASIGVARCAEAASLEQLMRRADAAMYEAKRQGKGRHVVFGGGLDQRPIDGVRAAARR